MVICITKYLLNEKKELSKIWLAAHWEKKIKRTQIFEVNIERSVQDILEAEIILDLRISGHLLVGIVKIHSRKTKYLLNECNSIFYQVKSFRTGIIDLPESKQTAAVNDITLTEFFGNFDDIENNLIDSVLTSNQTLIEEITLKETSENLTLLDDDDFMDFVFHEEDEPLEDFPLNLDNEVSQRKNLEIPVIVNGTEGMKETHSKQKKARNSNKKDESVPQDAFHSVNFVDGIPESNEMPMLLNEDEVIPLSDNLDPPNTELNHKSSDQLLLEPVKIQTSDFSKNKKIKKRKLHVDYIKTISYELIKKQVLDTADIISVLDLTPTTKRLMILKKIGRAENLLRLPALRFLNPFLLKLYQRNLKTFKCDDELEFIYSETDSFQNVNVPRKKSKTELPKNLSMDKNMPGKSFESVYITNMRNNMENDVENDFLDYGDNLMFDTELENVARNESEEMDQLVPEENMLNTSEGQSDLNNIQNTQVSKTSEERWEYALQGKIIQMLYHLKLLFEKKSVICFSSVTQNKKKSWVAQQFLCLLMLQKFQVISLKQIESFGEIFILPQVNFDTACVKFSNF